MIDVQKSLERTHSRSCPHCEGTGWLYENPGEVLRELRRSDGATQREMAHAMGISPQYLHDLEADNRPWTHEMVRRFLEILGLADEVLAWTHADDPR